MAGKAAWTCQVGSGTLGSKAKVGPRRVDVPGASRTPRGTYASLNVNTTAFLQPSSLGPASPFR